MKTSGLYQTIPLCQTTWSYNLQVHHLHAPFWSYILQVHHLHAHFFPATIPVAPTRPCAETMAASSVFITWNGFFTVLPVKICTLFSVFNNCCCLDDGNQNHTNLPWGCQQVLSSQNIRKKPCTLYNVKSKRWPSFEQPYNKKYFLQIRESLCSINHHAMSEQWGVAAQPHTI